MTSRTMYRYMLVALVLLLVTQGCTLSANQDATPTSSFIGTATFPMPTPPFSIPTTTPLPTETLTPPPTDDNCKPYTLWPAYVVQAGDTLGVIAALTGTTTARLVEANCLPDPDSIFIGQALYVPRLPPTPVPIPTDTPTLTPDPDMPRFGQALTANQHWIGADGQAVTYYGTVRLTVGVVTNATAVHFFVNDPLTGLAQFAGQDLDPWDGAFTDYTFPGPGSYTFIAKAENEAKRVNSSPFTVVYDPAYTPPGRLPINTLSIQPYISEDGGWYQVAGGATVTISWPHAPVGADSIVFMLTPTDSSTVGQDIGTDLNPSNGATTTWTVPGGISAYLQAHATMPDGSVQRSRVVNIFAE